MPHDTIAVDLWQFVRERAFGEILDLSAGNQIVVVHFQVRQGATLPNNVVTRDLRILVIHVVGGNLRDLAGVDTVAEDLVIAGPPTLPDDVVPVDLRVGIVLRVAGQAFRRQPPGTIRFHRNVDFVSVAQIGEPDHVGTGHLRVEIAIRAVGDVLRSRS